jgi:chaperonin GroES
VPWRDPLRDAGGTARRKERGDPRASHNWPKEGIVIAIGDGKTLDSGEKTKFAVGKGDRVLFTSYAGTEVKHDGETYIVMREDDILAIVG